MFVRNLCRLVRFMYWTLAHTHVAKKWIYRILSVRVPWKKTKTRIKYENIKCEFFFVSQEKNVEATKADQVEKAENVVFLKPLRPDSLLRPSRSIFLLFLMTSFARMFHKDLRKNRFKYGLKFPNNNKMPFEGSLTMTLAVASRLMLFLFTWHEFGTIPRPFNNDKQ